MGLSDFSETVGKFNIQFKSVYSASVLATFTDMPVQSRPSGTARAAKSKSKKRRRVVLYCGSDPKSDPTSYFFLTLFWRVLTLGREKGIDMIPVINTGSVNQKRLRPPEVTQAMKDQGVDGIIGMLLFESMTEWMDRDGIPYAVLSANNPNDVVLSNGHGIDHLEDSPILGALFQSALGCGVNPAG